MLVTNLKYCDFYVWSNGKTDNDKFFVRIEQDTALCETMMTKHAEVCDKVILPELLTRKSDCKNERKAKLYCLCHRSSKVSIIKVMQLPQITSVLKKLFKNNLQISSKEFLGKRDLTNIIDP